MWQPAPQLVCRPPRRAPGKAAIRRPRDENLVVNAQFDPGAPGGFTVLDGAHGYAVRDDVELVSGPDGWHGENFPLAF